MDLQIILELSAIVSFIGIIVSYFTFRKSSKLNYITQERKEWRESIRTIVEELERCPYDKRKQVLTKLKTRINTYGFCGENESEDSHIWKQIYIIEKCEQNDYENCREKLILFLGLLLKDDWEKAKKEVNGEPARGIIAICLVLAVAFLWIGVFDENGMKIEDMKKVGIGFLYTSPGMSVVIMGMIASLLMIGPTKQCDDKLKASTIVVINAIWIISTIMGVINIQFGKEKSVFIIASVIMIFFAGVMIFWDDFNDYRRIKKYKKNIEKINNSTFPPENLV
ncbi:hypothetical protein [Roseburia faecis]|uniref:hypothetical protein n=1 Tax=Roseburia faecis TaxID=301302 RepID=UPI0018A88812|nr:hypothetical protein [Roseburia faecis]